MSVCYYKRLTDHSIRSIDNFRYIDLKLMRFNVIINVNKLSNIVYKILSDYCKEKVIGYDKKNNIYWYKMYDTDYCKLHKVPTKSDVVIKRVLQESYGACEVRGYNEFVGVRNDYWEGIKWK